jgi:ATP-dependent DNA ligase
LARFRSPSCIIDGEAVACDDNGVALFDLTISASRIAHCIASLVAPSNVMPLITVRMTTPRR